MISLPFDKNNHVAFLRNSNSGFIEEYMTFCRKKYIHTAYGSSDDGIADMLLGDTFRLLHDSSDVNEKLRLLREMGKYPMLLIIKDCNIEDDELFSEIIKLPADILFITAEDYSDYGFVCIEGE